MDEYYRILEVQRGASIAEINAAKIRLLKMWHPDSYQRNPELARIAEERSKDINDAYDIVAEYLKTGRKPKTYHKKARSNANDESNTQTENARYEAERERRQRERDEQERIAKERAAEQERIAKEHAAEQERISREKAEQEAIRRSQKKKAIQVRLFGTAIISMFLAALFLMTRDVPKVQKTTPLGNTEVLVTSVPNLPVPKVQKITPPSNQSGIDEPGGSPMFAGTWWGNLSGLPFELQIWQDDGQWKATISFRGKVENLQVLGRKRDPETFYLYRPADVSHISMFIVEGNMNFAYLDSGTVRNVTLERVRSPTSSEPPDVSQWATVFDPPSNVRESPNGEILCSVGTRTTIRILSSTGIHDNNGMWYYTNVCGRTGVIHSTQIKF